MKFLMTGATGFLGLHLVKALLKQNHAVTVLTRHCQNAKKRLGQQVACHEWQPLTAPAPQEAFTAVDVVVNLAGENIAGRRWSSKQKREILNSRVVTTENLVSTINALQQKPKVLLNGSAIGIYADRGNETLTEASPVSTRDFLSEVCLKWESAAQQLDPGVRCVLLRTGIVLGKGGGALKRMLPPFKLGLGGRLGSGKQWMSWIHVDDWVNLVLFLAQNRDFNGPVNATAPNPVTNREFTKTLGAVLKRPTVFPAPAVLLKLALGEMAGFLLASQRCEPKRALEARFRFQYPVLEEALKDLL